MCLSCLWQSFTFHIKSAHHCVCSVAFWSSLSCCLGGENTLKTVFRAHLCFCLWCWLVISVTLRLTVSHPCPILVPSPAQTLNTAMKNVCEILTSDPEGGPARIPFETFAYIYQYLSALDPEYSAVETETYLANLRDTS